MNVVKLFLLIAIPDYVACQAKVPGFTPVMPLPKVLLECSGLVDLDGNRYAGLNDSGNKAGIYVFTRDSDEPTHYVAIEGAENRDWEELAADTDYIYIGDTGNNSGQRKDLMIYKVRKHELATANSLSAEEIHYSYADQDQFKASNNHNYDCEAMISLGDSLYLFTKNRGNGKTYCYPCPKMPGTYALTRKDSFDVDGLVTGAAYHLADGLAQLALIGYGFESQGYTPFILHFSGFNGSQFFQGNPRMITFDGNLQTETILFVDKDTVLVTNEAEHGDKGFIYKVSLKTP